MDRVIERPFWSHRIETSWQTRSLVWLSGARRLGKTILSRGLAGARCFNCDLPEVRARLADPVGFLRAFPDGSRIVLDEIHRAEDPSGILKIAADEFPHLRVLATGSSSPSAGGRFRDALTGRKWTVPLTPVLWRECPERRRVESDRYPKCRHRECFAPAWPPPSTLCPTHRAYVERMQRR